MLPRSVHLIVAILACTKARATFVPLDPGQPGTRLAYLLGASQARLLVTDAAGAALGTAEPPTLRLDEAVVQAEISGHAAGALDDAERGGAVRPEDPAYIVFTSGSTGRPKGVMVSHGAIAQEVQSFAAQVGGAPGEACVLVTSIAFDPAIQDIFVAFMQGMTVALMDEEARKDPPRVCSAILSYGAGYLSATPSALRALPLETLPDRFRIISGGEPFPAELLPRCRHLHLVANVYGPTEATVTTTWHSIRAEDTHGGPIPIGRPLAGYRVWILDRGLRPVPVGALGELCIGGGALADGYVGDPARTASAFHPNPFSAGRLYRTGDQARWRADGTIELLGRIDQQVKILGHRVEPAEVEHALRCLGWVADAAVLPYGDRPTLKLAAYVVPQAGCEVPSTATVRAALSTSLPRWMLPGAVLQMAALPYTTTGKIDLKALPYVAAAPASPGAGQMPRSEDERLLCDLFARLTGHKDVGVETDFFDIGGDSLAAIMLVTELRQMGRNVTLTQLASAPTPAGIAAGWIGGSRPRPAPDDRPTLFLVPGLGGEDPRLSTLCVAWGAIFNCVVLDYPDWACLAAPRFDLPALTDHFIYRIFDHTPNGPVLLAGYSLGGFVAWSIAKRLAGTPQPVQALFIFDSWIDEVVEAAKRSGTSDRVLRQVRAFTEAASGRDRAYLTQLLGEIIGRRLGSHPALLRLLAHVRRAHVPVHLRHWLHYSVSATRQLSIVNAQRIVEGLAGPPLDHTEVIVFEAAETSNLGGRATAMWRRLCTRLRTEQVSGNHLSMVKNRDFASLYQKLPRILFTLLSMPPPAGEDGMDDLGQGDPSDRPTAVQTAPMSRPATPLDHGGPEPWNLIVPQSQSCA